MDRLEFEVSDVYLTVLEAGSFAVEIGKVMLYYPCKLTRRLTTTKNLRHTSIPSPLSSNIRGLLIKMPGVLVPRDGDDQRQTAQTFFVK